MLKNGMTEQKDVVVKDDYQTMVMQKFWNFVQVLKEPYFRIEENEWVSGRSGQYARPQELHSILGARVEHGKHGAIQVKVPGTGLWLMMDAKIRVPGCLINTIQLTEYRPKFLQLEEGGWLRSIFVDERKKALDTANFVSAPKMLILYRGEVRLVHKPGGVQVEWQRRFMTCRAMLLRIDDLNLRKCYLRRMKR